MKKLNKLTSPKPDRPIKILQFGEGNFLRGFVDWMVDIMNERTGFNSHVQIIQPLPSGTGDLLNSQDGMYHVLLQGIQSGKPLRQIHLVTCINSVWDPYKDYGGFLALGENPELKFIISNTTEAGIQFVEEEKYPPAVPKMFPGKLTALLYHRFLHFGGDMEKGLVFFPCELIEANGSNLKECVLRYALYWNLSEEFSVWVQKANIFCNTLVDRIVPGFPDEFTIEKIQEETGLIDKMVVMAEPFHLWVIEGPTGLSDIFPAEKAGLQVKFVEDLLPYRLQKVRILNGIHTVMVPLAYLRGLRTVKEAVDDPEMGSFIRETIFEEIIPTLDLPRLELEQYATEVLERFRNPFLRHELITISLNSISKFKVRVLPTILEYKRKQGKWPVRLIRSFAALIFFYKGKLNGKPIRLNDMENVLDFFDKIWKEEKLEILVAKTLSNKEFWGDDLSLMEGLQFTVLSNLEELTQKYS